MSLLKRIMLLLFISQLMACGQKGALYYPVTENLEVNRQQTKAEKTVIFNNLIPTTVINSQELSVNIAQQLIEMAE